MAHSNIRQDYDALLQTIADYVINYKEPSAEALSTARYCLQDSLGCAMLALQFPACTRHLGPVVAGTIVPHGVRVPGTAFELDPIRAALNIGMLIRWLDFNDTWLAAEWGHPSDNLGAILAVADYLSRSGRKALNMHDVLLAMIKAYEIQGILALNNSFNRVGLDHVVLVKVASTAVATQLLGGDRDAVLRALSQAFVDGQSLRTYRHAPNTGSRKSWAAGDATSRGVQLALLTMQGEMGIPSVLTAPTWGFQDVLFRKQTLSLTQPLSDYVMRNILFKISFPAEFHAQTAVEAAVRLHPELVNRIDAIKTIHLTTHESAIRIINKTGPLYNPADRDHCLQYMVAVALLTGTLTAEHYQDAFAAQPAIDVLRDKMVVQENVDFSRDYLDPTKRSISNTLQIEFNDSSKTEAISIEYPLGHQRRRAEGIPVLLSKFTQNMLTQFTKSQVQQLTQLAADLPRLSRMGVSEFMDLLVKGT